MSPCNLLATASLILIRHFDVDPIFDSNTIIACLEVVF